MWDLILVPAYGRTYADSAAVKEDWLDGRDFKIAGGPYTSIRDIELLNDDFGTVAICYNAGNFLEV